MKNQLKLTFSKKVADRSHFGSNIESLLYKFYMISDDLVIQRNKKVEAQPRPLYSSELVNRLKSYTMCSKK